jgi:hypothetical protein
MVERRCGVPSFSSAEELANRLTSGRLYPDGIGHPL